MVIYRMNVDLAGHKKGAWWTEENAPDIVKLWAKMGGGVFNGAPIILIEKDEISSVVSKMVCPKCGHKFGESEKKKPTKTDLKASAPEKDESGKPFKTLEEINQEKMDNLQDEDDEEKEVRKCKGFKGDGSPCGWTGKKVRDNGYCFMHQDQYKPTEGGES